ncbi:MAG: hypothetical protein K2X43_14680 [Hyphomonadaceae bacterium]|jgi:hypothetical protein|nr:hypothetical protein [Hyphomonadaceae bacterium]
MTGLGDADLSEGGEMSLSGHSTPEAKWRYVKKTETQQLRCRTQTPRVDRGTDRGRISE